MSYGPPPPPSGGVNPYGDVPEGEGSANPSMPSYGTPPPPPAAPTGPAYGTPPPPTGPSYGGPSASGPTYGSPAGSYSPHSAASRYTAPGSPGYGGWIASTRDNGKGTGALIMGIVSVVLCFTTIISVGLGVGAVLMGVQGRKAADAGTADNRGTATAGMVLGIVGIVLGGIGALGMLAQLGQV